MKKFAIFFTVFMLVGCHHHKPSKPDPKPTATPVVTLPSNPEIKVINGQNFLNIGGNKPLAAGLYTLLVDAERYPTPDSIRAELRRYAQANYNLARVWVKTYFKPSDWQPWPMENGKYMLAKENPHFYNRADMIATIADEEGVCITWVLFDFWSIRQAFGYPPNYSQPDSLCPSRHVDPISGNNQMMTLNGYYAENGGPYLNGDPRARRLFKCQYCNNDPNCGCTENEIGCRRHPAWIAMTKRIADIAKRHNDMIYISSEMSTDNEHAEWDTAAMVAHTKIYTQVIKSIFPNCIIGTSVLGSRNSQVYNHVDIADLHGLGYGEPCCPGDIPSKNGQLRQIVPKATFCFNSDGCMSGCGGQSRYSVDYIVNAARNAWNVGGFFETKAIEQPMPESVFEAGRVLGKQKGW